MQFFRNLQIFRLPEKYDLSSETLQEKLSAKPFQSCESNDRSSRGWDSPTGDDRFVLSVAGHHLIVLKSEEKILPASVINDFAQDKADEIEAQQGFKPGRKQFKEIKEAVLSEMLPKAFARRRKTSIWLAPEQGWLIVDASTPAKAEEALDALRDTLDELPARLVKTGMSPVTIMSEWLLADDVPAPFTVDAECELRSPSEENATVRYIRHSLDGDEIRAHLSAGKLPTRLAVTYDDRVSFILTDSLELRRVAFLDLVQEKSAEVADTTDLQIEGDFAILTGELTKVLDGLMDVLCECKPD